MGNKFKDKKKSPVNDILNAGKVDDLIFEDESNNNELAADESAVSHEQSQNQQQQEQSKVEHKDPEQKPTPTEEEIKQELEVSKLEENGVIVLKKKNKKKTKDYKNFYLSTSTIAMIKKFAKQLEMGESELVDTLLKDAFGRIEIK